MHCAAAALDEREKVARRASARRLDSVMFCCTVSVCTSPDTWRSSGTMRDASRDAFAARPSRRLSASTAHAAPRVLVHAEQRLHDLRPAGAHQAVDAENLPGADLEAMP